MKIVFTANGRCASAAVEPEGQPITAGSRGVPAEIHLSPEYDGLVVTAFFRSEYGAWPVVLNETPGTVTIPWEAMEKKSLTFDVGVVGKNGDGTIVIPTIWARVGKIVPATEDSGLEPSDPSADIGAQIVEQARAAAKKAEDAAEAAEDARDKMPRIVDGTWRVYNAVTESWEDTGIQAEGQDGVGISDATMNTDYTLTLTFTDGSSYTTPSIRGAQGERGPIGPTPDISIGTVTTGAAGSQAEATMTGTPERPVLNLTIPRGDPGEVTQAEFDDLSGRVTQNTEKIDDLDEDLTQQKSAIEALDSLVDRKAGMLVDTASGAIASFVPDATIDNLLGLTVDIEPVQDLHGYDNPWPAGGGINKFDVDNPSIVAGYIGTSSFSTGNDRAKTVYIPISPNTTYTVSKLAGQRFCIATAPTAPADNVPVSVRNANNTASSLTITSGADDAFLWAWVYLQDTDTVSLDTMLASIQIEVGSTATAWTPYENNCPISGWDAVEVDAAGENLLPYPPPKSAASRTETFNPATCFFLKHGTYTFAFDRFDNATSWRFGIVLFDARKERYYVPSEILGNDFGHNDSGRYYVNGSNRTDTVFSLTMPFDGYIRLFFLLGDTTDASVCVNPRICIGTTASEYHPFAGNRYTIALGQTVYGAKLTIAEDGSVTALVDTVKAIADGTIAPTSSNANSASFLRRFPEAAGYSLAATALKCNRLRPSNYSSANDNLIFFSNAAIVTMRVSEEVTDWVSWLRDNPVEFSYKIANPITIHLDPVTISTIAGQTNNVWADAGGVSVEFAADLKHYIDSKIAAAVAALS